MSAGQAMFQKLKVGPELMVIVLPEAATDIYTAVKQYVYFSTRTACASLTWLLSFGDIKVCFPFYAARVKVDVRIPSSEVLRLSVWKLISVVVVMHNTLPICAWSMFHNDIKPQLSANPLSHRINVKMGGINTIPDPASVRALTDDKVPTIVMGVSRNWPSSSNEWN